MPLESASYINGLVDTNPVDTDNEAQGADHLRLIKAVLLATFPNLTGAMTATQATLNSLTAGNGTAIRFNGAVPVGSIHWFPLDPGTTIMAKGGTATGGEQYIECDGSSYPTSKFPDLAASGMVTISGSNFSMPQMNDTGRFVRARTSTVTAGTSQANQNQAHTHTATDAGHSHTATSTDAGHTHTATDSGHTHGPPGNGGNDYVTLNGGPSVGTNGAGGGNQFAIGSSTGTGTANITVATGHASITTTVATGNASITVSSQGGTEARPEAYVAVCCLKT